MAATGLSTRRSDYYSFFCNRLLRYRFFCFGFSYNGFFRYGLLCYRLFCYGFFCYGRFCYGFFCYEFFCYSFQCNGNVLSNRNPYLRFINNLVYGFHLGNVGAFVDDHGLKLQEGFVDGIAKGGIWCEVDFRVGTNLKTLSGTDVHALSGIDIDNLEGSKTLDFHYILVHESILDDLEEGTNEILAIAAGKAATTSQGCRQVGRRQTRITHDSPPFWVRSRRAENVLKLSTNFGGTSIR